MAYIVLEKRDVQINIFSYFYTKHMLWYFLQAPLHGASDEYLNICFECLVREIRNTRNVSTVHGCPALTPRPAQGHDPLAMVPYIKRS